MSFQSIRAAIQTKLAEVTELAFVYDYHNPNMEGFPCASFDVSDVSDDFLTDKENIRKFAWQVVIYQEITDRGIDAANTLLDGACDAVIQKFEDNLSLGGAVDYCNAVVGNRENIDTPLGLVRAQYLTLTTVQSVSVA